MTIDSFFYIFLMVCAAIVGIRASIGVVGFCETLYLYYRDKRSIIKEDIISFIGSIIGIIFFIVVFWGVPTQVEKFAREDLIESEYTAYLDGEEVDLKKVDFSLYEISCDHENKIVYMTEKNKKTYIVIPFFISN